MNPAHFMLLAGGADSAFSPTQITGLYAWYDFSDTATITHSSNAVSQVTDKSGLGHTVTQSTAGAKPTTNTITRNGNNVLDFDGGDHLAAATASDWKFLHDGSTYRLFIACKAGNVSNPAARYAIIGNGDTTAEIGFFFAADDRAGSDEEMQHLVLNATGSPSVSALTTGGWMTPNNWHYVELKGDYSGAASLRSQITIDSHGENPNTSGSAVSSSNPSNPLRIGRAGSDGTSPDDLVGQIGEIIIYNTTVAGADLTAIRAYLAAKWSITTP